MRIKVAATVVVEVDVEVPEGTDPFFIVEENGCPGTGAVGAAIEKQMREDTGRSVCWACNLRGANKIVAIDGRPVENVRTR